MDALTHLKLERQKERGVGGRLYNEITFNEHQWPNIKVSIASLTRSVVEFRACGLRSLESEVPNYTKDFSHPQGYIHPKWAFLPTGPSLSQTIDNRPVLATTIRTFAFPNANPTKSSKFIVSPNCSNHSGVRVLSAMVSWTAVKCLGI